MIAGLALSIGGSANHPYRRFSVALASMSTRSTRFEFRLSQALSDDELRGQTELFRQRLAGGEKIEKPPSRSLRDGSRGGEPALGHGITTCS